MRGKEAIIERLCLLVTGAASRVFSDQYSHDCFCGRAPFQDPHGPIVDEVVLQFIEDAVEEKIAREPAGRM